jgi:hypothetical protein
MKFKSLSVIAAAVALSALVSCGGGKPVEFTHEIKDIKLHIDPPVTQGPNTFQAEMQFNLDEVFKTNKADRTKIKDVSIDDLSFTMEGGRNFDNFESFVVNFFSDKNDMTKLASLSPVPKGVSVIKTPVTEKAKLQDYFSEPVIFLIVDANMTSTDTLGYDITGNMKVKFSAMASK